MQTIGAKVSVAPADALTIRVWWDQIAYVAHLEEGDVTAQGATIPQALERLALTAEAEAATASRTGGETA